MLGSDKVVRDFFGVDEYFAELEIKQAEAALQLTCTDCNMALSVVSADSHVCTSVKKAQEKVKFQWQETSTAKESAASLTHSRNMPFQARSDTGLF